MGQPGSAAGGTAVRGPVHSWHTLRMVSDTDAGGHRAGGGFDARAWLAFLQEVL